MALILDGTNGLSDVDGSAATPAIRGSDANTGVFFGSDVVGLSTGGSERVRVDASGNVGIGTSSPSYKLDVSGNGRVTGDFYVGASTNIIYESSSNLNVRAANSLLFLTNGANERARIDSSGNLLVGRTTNLTGDPVRLAIQSSATTTFGAYLTTAGTGAAVAIFYSDVGGTQTARCIVRSSGNLENVNNSYGAISDAKLKENIVDTTPKLDKLNQVRIVNFNMIGDEQKQIGVIAQELEQIFPGMVEESPDRDAEGNDLGTTTKAVKYSVFVPMLIKAIQELKGINDAQAQIITALTARVEALEGAQ
jgi:hypothetical protein